MIKILISFATLLTLVGCGTLNPTGVYKGDKTLYAADLAITTSYDVMHSFVLWEKSNRLALSGMPEVKAAADNIRKNAPLWIKSALACRDAYATSPTDINLSSLQKALAVLNAAVGEATKYFNQASKGV